MPNTLLMLTFSFLMALSSACTKKASAPSSSGGKDDAGDDDDDDDIITCLTGRNDDEETAELHLQGSTTYEDIKDILEDNCTSCHGSSLAEADIKLHTYTNVKKNAEAALAAIDDGSMPQDAELDDADKEAIRAFIDGGLKESGDDEGSSSSNCGSSGGSGGGGDDHDDDDGTDDSAVDVANFAAVLNPPELQACHDRGKIFWRHGTAEHALGYCIDIAYPAAFKCNRAGVMAAFNNHPDVITNLDQLEADGWVYDQCGVDKKNKPVAVLRCIIEGGKCIELKDADPAAMTIEPRALAIEPTDPETMPPL